MKKVLSLIVGLCCLNAAVMAETAKSTDAKQVGISTEDRKKAAADDRGHQAQALTQKRFDDLLKTYNSDQDQQLTWDEYNAWRLQRFNDTDANNNNWVSEAEYVNEFGARLEVRYVTFREAQIKQTNMRFTALDKNKNKTIEREEIELSGEKIFARWDKNKDGIINDDDALEKAKGNAPRRSSLRMPTSHNKEDMFTLYDSNDDGDITAREFKVERQTIYHFTDVNKDGVLDQQEYQDEFMFRVETKIKKARHGSIRQTFVRFSILDDNDDQMMTFDELQISGKRIFNRWDKNQDGIISEADVSEK